MIIDDRMMRGTLVEAAEEAMRFITAHLRVAFEITGEKLQRTEIFDYPRHALRELLFNAIIHRDYMSPTDVQIKIFDQSILFFNPGKLYGGEIVKQQGHDIVREYPDGKTEIIGHLERTNIKPKRRTYQLS